MAEERAWEGRLPAYEPGCMVVQRRHLSTGPVAGGVRGLEPQWEVVVAVVDLYSCLAVDVRC